MAVDGAATFRQRPSDIFLVLALRLQPGRLTGSMPDTRSCRPAGATKGHGWGRAGRTGRSASPQSTVISCSSSAFGTLWRQPGGTAPVEGVYPFACHLRRDARSTSTRALRGKLTSELGKLRRIGTGGPDSEAGGAVGTAASAASPTGRLAQMLWEHRLHKSSAPEPDCEAEAVGTATEGGAAPAAAFGTAAPLGVAAQGDAEAGLAAAEREQRALPAALASTPTPTPGHVATLACAGAEDETSPKLGTGMGGEGVSVSDEVLESEPGEDTEEPDPPRLWYNPVLQHSQTVTSLAT